MDQFIQQLLQDQGVPQDLEPDVRQQLVTELTERATDFINQRLIDAMSDESAEHLNVLLDEDPLDMQRVQDFIATNVPDKESVAARAMVEFRALYLGAKA